MEGNKDEALRCLDIARKHYSDGNLPQAIKFVNKSINLYPTDSARELLTTYENSSAQRQSSPEPTTTHAPKSSSSSSSSQRTSRPSSSSSTPSSTSSSPANERPYTPEQLQAVQRIRRLKDYYEILEITKEAKEGEIKKAYRKLALIMHPDKNGAPGAEDAFKAVSKAFACLSDPEARKRYDLHGPDAPPASSPFSHHSRHSHSHHPYGFESDLTPEQIFEMMFGMGRPPGGGGGGFRTYTYRAGGGGPRRQQQQQADPDLSTLLMQFLPIILLGLVFFFFASGGEDPHFSLQRTGSYIYQRETAHWGVRYWVKLETEQKILRKSMDLGTLEREVERHWKADKDKKCSYEHQQKNRMERAAYYASGDDKEFMREKIDNYAMPNCEELSRVTRVS